MPRVFVSGIGVVSPLGNSREALWDSLVAGRSGLGQVDIIRTDDLPVTIGGQVRDLDRSLAEQSDKLAARRMDRASIFAVIAAKEAIEHAGLAPESLRERCGVVIGSGLAGLLTMQDQTENLLNKGPRKVSVLTIPMIMPNGPPANISLAFGTTGPCYNTASACASSNHAMIDAMEMIRRGQVDVAITGGSEASLTRMAMSAFSNMKALTKKYNDNPTAASRPFEAHRDGFVISEGGVVLIFESEQHLAARGGQALAEVVGYGDMADSHHLVAPDPEGKGAARAMRDALKMAGVDPDEVAPVMYVNAHGTSTPLNDAMETAAIKAAFGSAAEKLQVSSTKGMSGHLVGAASAIEAAVCVLALQNQLLPATINYETPDPALDLDYIPNEPRQADVEFALSNSFGFGGHNTSLVLRRVG